MLINALAQQLRQLQSTNAGSPEARTVNASITNTLSRLAMDPQERSGWPEQAGQKLMQLVFRLNRAPQANAVVKTAAAQFIKRLGSIDATIIEQLSTQGPPYGLPHSRALLDDISASSPRSAAKFDIDCLIAVQATGATPDSFTGEQLQSALPKAAALPAPRAPSVTIPKVTKHRLTAAQRSPNAPLSALDKRLEAHPLDKSFTQVFRDKFKVSELRDTSGNSILMTNKLIQGSYGKCRIGIAPNGKIVAVKEMRRIASRNPRPGKTHLSSDRAVAQEFEVMRSMHGNNMALSLCQSDKSNFIVMELMDGDLVEIYNRLYAVPGDDGQKLRLSACAKLMVEISAQTNHAHNTLEIVLADIKPENIFIKGSSDFLLGDFGLAEKLNGPSGTTQAPLSGTPGYLAPEIFETGVPIGAKADIWSAFLTGLQSLRCANLPSNPLIDCRGADGKKLDKDPGIAAAKAIEKYATWRKHLQRRNGPGPIDLAQLHKGKSQYDAYFAGLHAVSPAICRFALDRALVIDPTQRCDSQELSHWSQELHAKHRDPAQLQAFVRKWSASNAARDSFIGQLKLYQQELVKADPKG
jgi:serine/threonine protein kinase